MKEKQASHQRQFWSVIPMVKVGNTITPLVPPQPQGRNTLIPLGENSLATYYLAAVRQSVVCCSVPLSTA